MKTRPMTSRFATRALLASAASPRKAGIAAAAGLFACSLLWANSASAQAEAFFSIEGDLTSNGSSISFIWDMPTGSTSADILNFRTYRNAGLINEAGDPTIASAIDPFLSLTSISAGISVSNDDGATGPNSGFDSLLAYPGIADSGGTLPAFGLPSANDYILTYRDFGDNSTGHIMLDAVGSASELVLKDIVVNGSASIDSLKFGAGFPDSGPTIDAVFDYDTNATLTINNELELQNIALLSVDNGQITVGGETRADFLSEIEINGGTFAANGPVNIDDARIDVNSGSFILGTNQTATFSNQARFDHTPNFAFQDGGTVIIESGSDADFDGFFALGNGSPGTVRVTGSGSTLDATSAFNVFWGVNGGQAVFEVLDDATAVVNQAGGVDLAQSASSATSGTINVIDGGDLTLHTRLDVADGSAGSATVTVDGSGSTFTMPGAATLKVGATGSATGTGVVSIANSGVFTTGTGLTTINNTGSVNINTGGVFNINGDITVNGGTIDSNTTGFNLGSNQTLIAQDNASVTLNGETFFIVTSGQTFDVLSGADISFDQALSIDGSMTVDGSGSLLTVNTDLTSAVSDVGAFGSSGVLTLSNGATGTISAGNLHIASTAGGTAPSTSGTLNVQSGADLILASLRLTHFDTNTGTGVVNVDGSGSTITQAGTSTLIVGNSVAGTATINLTNSGVFNTGTGTTTIKDTGTLNISTGGVFSANGDINVDGGTIDVDSASSFNLVTGGTLTATNEASISIDAGYRLDGGRTFDILSGSDLTFNSFLEMGFPNTDGTINVEGTGSSLTMNTGFQNQWGAGGGTAELNLRDGATGNIQSFFNSVIARTNTNAASVARINVGSGAGLIIDEVEVGNAVAGTAEINVSGTGSSLNQSGASTLLVGNDSGSGTGSVNITDSGTFTTGTGLTTIDSTGSVNINTGGTFSVIGDINVNGGSLTTADTANAFSLLAGRTLTATNNAQISFDGPRYTLGVGRTFNILSGSDFTAANGLDMGSGNTGTLLVDGPGSTLDINSGTMFIAFNGGSADITLSNGAAGDFENALFLATLNNNSTGTINVESGATLSLKQLAMASDTFGPSTGATSDVTVTGNGSTITQTGAVSLDVGGTGAGTSANLTINSGGVFNTGTGQTTVSQNGTINLAAGTFNANGDVVINGGSLDLSSGTANLGLLDLNGPASVTLVSATLNADTIDYTDVASGFNFNGGTLSVDTFIGILDQDGGTLAPGQSAGTTSLAGYNLNSGIIAIELGGTTEGTEHDEVIVGGTLGLGAGSILDVTLIDSFVPSAGDSFDILDFNAVLGSFAAINLPTLDPGLVWVDADLLTTGVLSVASNLLPGDTDGDGDVDDSDLGTSFSNYTGPLTPGTGGKTLEQGDTDGDGDVDDSDLGTSFSNYTGPLAVSIPEPTSLLAMGVGGLLLAGRRRK